jgi:hypothetical protein
MGRSSAVSTGTFLSVPTNLGSEAKAKRATECEYGISERLRRAGSDRSNARSFGSTIEELSAFQVRPSPWRTAVAALSYMVSSGLCKAGEVDEDRIMSENCAMCAAPFGSPAALVDHMRSDHKNDDPSRSLELNPEAHLAGLVCALCGVRFPSAEALTDHNLSRPERRRATRRRLRASRM